MVACRGLTPAPSPLFWHISLPSSYWWLTGGLLVACWWLPCRVSLFTAECAILAHVTGLPRSDLKQVS